MLESPAGSMSSALSDSDHTQMLRGYADQLLAGQPQALAQPSSLQQPPNLHPPQQPLMPTSIPVRRDSQSVQQCLADGQKFD